MCSRRVTMVNASPILSTACSRIALASARGSSDAARSRSRKSSSGLRDLSGAPDRPVYCHRAAPSRSVGSPVPTNTASFGSLCSRLAFPDTGVSLGLRSGPKVPAKVPIRVRRTGRDLGGHYQDDGMAGGPVGSANGDRSENRRKKRRGEQPLTPTAAGAMLAEARVRLGIELSEVNDRTGISRRNLEALESGEVQHFSDPSAAAVAMRRYADLVDLDPEPLIGSLASPVLALAGAPSAGAPPVGSRTAGSRTGGNRAIGAPSKGSPAVGPAPSWGPTPGVSRTDICAGSTGTSPTSTRSLRPLRFRPSGEEAARGSQADTLPPAESPAQGSSRPATSHLVRPHPPDRRRRRARSRPLQAAVAP